MCTLRIQQESGETEFYIEDEGPFVTIKIRDPLVGASRLVLDESDLSFLVEALITHGLGAFTRVGVEWE